MLNPLWPSDAIWYDKSGSSIVQVIACYLTAPSHYLDQCWLVISVVLWHSPETNFTVSAQTTILCNEFKDYTFLKLLPHLLWANELDSLVNLSANGTQIARFTGPTWGPPGSYRPQMGPMLAPWTLLSGYLSCGMWSILQMLMPWFVALPAHHQPQYW